MKILHTSDWHLGARLYNYDRSAEEEHFFRQLGDLVERERPDLLAICGDVFHTGAPGNDTARAFTERLLETTARCPDMETVAIAGNHDSYSRLAVDAALWKRCRVHVFGVPAEDESGNAVFDGNIIEIPGKGIVAAVPFCHPRNFPLAPGADEAGRAKAYFAGLAARVAERNSADLPCVLLAHLAAGSGTDFTGQDRRAVIGGEECEDPAIFGAAYDYIALGHVHCPQWVAGSAGKARYCGTPRAIHFDETYPHGADIAVAERGRPPVLRTEVFEPLRKLRTFGGKNGAPFEKALQEMADCAGLEPETYVRLNVAIGHDGHPGPDWNEKARKAAEAAGLRFCLVNLVREPAPEGRTAPAAVLGVEELKMLSSDKVVDILAQEHPLTDRQRSLLKGLLEDFDR